MMSFALTALALTSLTTAASPEPPFVFPERVDRTYLIPVPYLMCEQQVGVVTAVSGNSRAFQVASERTAESRFREDRLTFGFDLFLRKAATAPCLRYRAALVAPMLDGMTFKGKVHLEWSPDHPRVLDVVVERPGAEWPVGLERFNQFEPVGEARTRAVGGWLTSKPGQDHAKTFRIVLNRQDLVAVEKVRVASRPLEAIAAHAPAGDDHWTLIVEGSEKQPEDLGLEVGSDDIRPHPEPASPPPGASSPPGSRSSVDAFAQSTADLKKAFKDAKSKTPPDLVLLVEPDAKEVTAPKGQFFCKPGQPGRAKAPTSEVEGAKLSAKKDCRSADLVMEVKTRPLTNSEAESAYLRQTDTSLELVVPMKNVKLGEAICAGTALRGDDGDEISRETPHFDTEACVFRIQNEAVRGDAAMKVTFWPKGTMGTPKLFRGDNGEELKVQKGEVGTWEVDETSIQVNIEPPEGTDGAQRATLSSELLRHLPLGTQTLKCKITKTNREEVCGSARVAFPTDATGGSSARSLELRLWFQSSELRKLLADGEPISVSLELGPGVKLKKTGSKDTTTALTLSLLAKRCVFSAEQVTKVYSGFQDAEVIIRLRNRGGDCKPPLFDVKTASTLSGFSVAQRAEVVRPQERGLFRLRVSSAQSPVPATVYLTLHHQDGSDLILIERALRLDLSPSPRVSGPIEVELPGEAPDARSFELRPSVPSSTLAALRPNRFRFEAEDPEVWSLESVRPETYPACALGGREGGGRALEPRQPCVRPRFAGSDKVQISVRRTAKVRDIRIDQRGKFSGDDIGVNLGTMVLEPTWTASAQRYPIRLDDDGAVRVQCLTQVAGTTILPILSDERARCQLRIRLARNTSPGDKSEVLRAFVRRYGPQDLGLKVELLGPSATAGTAAADAGVPFYGHVEGEDLSGLPAGWEVAANELVIPINLEWGVLATAESYSIITLTISHPSSGDDVELPPLSSKTAQRSFRLRLLPDYGAYRGANLRTTASLLAGPMYRTVGWGAKASSGYDAIGTVTVSAGATVGMELWNFEEDRPNWTIFNPQLQLGGIVSDLDGLHVSGLVGISLRLPFESAANSPVKGTTSVGLWLEMTELDGHFAAAGLFGAAVNLTITDFGPPSKCGR